MSRIYGIDPGNLSEESIKKALHGPELELNQSIAVLFMNLVRDRSYERYWTNNPDRVRRFQEDLYAYNYLVYQTKRFGTDIQEPKEGEYIRETRAYWDWFRWWRKYLHCQLEKETLIKIKEGLISREDLGRFRPEGDWRT